MNSTGAAAAPAVSRNSGAGVRTGVAVASQREFYEQLWSRRAGDLIEVAVQRNGGVRVIAVPSVDRHSLFRVRD